MTAMRARLMKSLAVGAVTTALAAAPASAGVREYNDAMSRQDYAAATAEAAQIWRDQDRAAPETATLAREFGFAAYLAGDYETAQSYTAFLENEGDRLATPDDQPLTSEVLAALVDYKLGPNRRHRNALFSALEARVAGAEDVDLISLIAAEDLQRADWLNGEFDDAGESAGLTAALAAKGGAAFLSRRRAAEVSQDVALFRDSYDPEAFIGLADTHDAIAADIDAADSEEARALLWPVLYNAEAWAETVRAHTIAYPPQRMQRSTGTRMAGVRSAYAGTTTENTPDRLPHEQRLQAPQLRFAGRMSPETTIEIRDRKLGDPAALPSEAANAADARPRCAGSLRGETEALSATYGTYGDFDIGAVVLSYKVAADGSAYEPQVLAAAPTDSRAAEAIEMTEGWRFQPDAGVNTASCRIASDYEKAVVIFTPGAAL